MTSAGFPPPRPDRVAAQRNREAAFGRIARVRGATIVGAGALTAAVAGVVSAVAPGHTLGAKATARSIVAKAPATPAATSSASHAATLPPLASPSQLGLQGPNDAPQSAPTQQSAPSSQQSAPQQSAPAQSSVPAAPAAVTGGS